MPDPYVSVVVAAYNRKRYLPDALRSLERQTLDKSRFEVIVVKNFEDPASDEIIRRNGWRWVYSDERWQGPFTLAGIEEARGEVVTFLDDDVYVPERLLAVERAFREAKELAYFHNAQLLVDEEGRPAGARGLSGRQLCFTPASIPLREADRLAVDFNSSSIAVRRDVLASGAGLIKLIRRSFDTALFAASLRYGEGRALCHVGEPLTLYRWYSGPSSSARGLGAVDDVVEWARRYASVMRDYYADYSAMLGFVQRGRGAELIRLRLVTSKMILALARGVSGSHDRASLGDYVSLLSLALRGLYTKRALLAAASWPLPLRLRLAALELIKSRL